MAVITNLGVEIGREQSEVKEVEVVEPVTKDALKKATEAVSRLIAIEALGDQIAKLEQEIGTQEGRVNAAKEAYQAEQQTLRGLRTDLDNRMDDLAKLSRGGFAESLFPGVGATIGEAPKPDDWEKVKLADLDGLEGDFFVKAFAKNGIETIGELSAFTKDRRLTDLKGVGEAKAAHIEAALDKFWKARNGKHTSQDGDPKSASRGAEVVRLKKELGDEIEAKLIEANVEATEENCLRFLGHFTGAEINDSAAAAKAKLESVTIRDLERLIPAVRAFSASDVEAVFS